MASGISDSLTVDIPWVAQGASVGSPWAVLPAVLGATGASVRRVASNMHTWCSGNEMGTVFMHPADSQRKVKTPLLISLSSS